MKFCHLKGIMGYLLFRLPDGNEIHPIKNFVLCPSFSAVTANRKAFQIFSSGIPLSLTFIALSITVY